MVGKVGRRHCVASRPRHCFSRVVCGRTGGGMCRDSGQLRDTGLHLAAAPCPPNLDGLSWPAVRMVKLEEWQQVFRTVRCP